MKCSICGSENNGTKFCTSCGAKLYAEDNTAALSTADLHVSESGTVSDSDLTAAEASVADAAAELDSTAGEALHNLTGTVDSVSESEASGSYTEGAYSSDENVGTGEKSDDSGSGNYYDAGYQGGASYNETYTEGGGYIGFSIASMICGILSMLCCICGCGSLPLSIAAIVLGIITITKHYDGKGMAIAGLITGGLGLVLGVIMTAVYVSDSDVQRSVEDVFDL